MSCRFCSCSFLLMKDFLFEGLKDKCLLLAQSLSATGGYAGPATMGGIPHLNSPFAQHQVQIHMCCLIFLDSYSTNSIYSTGGVYMDLHGLSLHNLNWNTSIQVLGYFTTCLATLDVEGTWYVTLANYNYDLACTGVIWMQVSISLQQLHMRIWMCSHPQLQVSDSSEMLLNRVVLNPLSSVCSNIMWGAHRQCCSCRRLLRLPCRCQRATCPPPPCAPTTRPHAPCHPSATTWPRQISASNRSA